MSEAPIAPVSRPNAILGGVFIAVLIMVGIPLTIAISADPRLVEAPETFNATPPPPQIDIEPPPPDIPPPEPETPEMERDTPPPNLTDLEVAFGATMGGTGGAIALPAFNAADDLDSMIFDVSEVDEIPVAINRVNPVTPPEFRRRNTSADVVVIMVVTKEGRVRDARIHRSSNDGFNDAVLNAVRRWTFQPGSIGGQPVDTRVLLPFTF